MRGRNGWRSCGLALTILAAGILIPGCGRKRGGEVAGPCNPTISQVAPYTGDIAGGDVVTIETTCFQDDFTLHPPRVSFGMDWATVTPVDADTLTVITPPHPTPEGVDVDVRSTGTVQFAYLPLGFTYTKAPCAVLSVRPNQGSTVGGQTVSIDGTDFDLSPLPAPTVEFGPGNPSSNVTVRSETLLEVEMPAAAGPGPVDVIVTTQAGSCQLAAGYEYFASGPCTVTAAEPTGSYMDRTTTVYLTGTGFDLPPLPTPAVEFGPGNYGTGVSVIGSDRLVVEAPTSATAGWVDVTVWNQAGPCTLSGGFEYLAPPPPPSCTISSVEPSFGPDFGGTDLRILGTDFTIHSRVWMGTGEVSPIFFVSDTEIRFTTPPGVGLVDVTVDIGGGTTCISNFTYVSCGGTTCQLQRAVPSTGSVGDLVTISGSGFEMGAQVFFGDAPDHAQAAIFDDSGLPTDLVVIVPPQPGPGPTVDIHVVNPSGVCCTRANGFTYGGCFIESVIPDRGTPRGVVNVMIRGEGFTARGGDVPEVWFGTEPSPDVLPWSPTELVATTPPALGQTAVELTVIYPTGETCSYCCYNYFPGCYIDSIVPDSGGTNGGDFLTITGWGFDSVVLPPPGFTPSIRFDGVYAHPFFVTVDPTGTLITLLSPPSYTGGPKDVEIFNLLFVTRCTAVDGFTYILPGASPCGVTDIDPDWGLAMGGDWVTIRGDGFDENTGVLFGLVPSPLVVLVSPQELQVVTPLGLGQDVSTGCVPVDVVVAPQGSDPCILPGGFRYCPPPCQAMCGITGVSPDSGPVAGGNTVMVSGHGLCDPDDPSHPPGFLDVYFGMELAQATYVDSTTLSVVVPPSVTGAGPVDVIYMDSTGCLAFCQGCYTYN